MNNNKPKMNPVCVSNASANFTNEMTFSELYPLLQTNMSQLNSLYYALDVIKCKLSGGEPSGELLNKPLDGNENIMNNLTYFHNYLNERLTLCNELVQNITYTLD